MKNKFVLGSLVALLAIGISGCGPTSAPTSTPTEAPTSSPTETPTTAPTETPTTAPTGSYEVSLDLVQTGLGSAFIGQAENSSTHVVAVTPISGVTVESVTLNGEPLTLDSEGMATFEATAGGSDVVSVRFNEPELTSEFTAAVIDNVLKTRTINAHTYEVFDLILHNATLEEMTNKYRRYESDFYSNGVVSDVVIGRLADTDTMLNDDYNLEIGTTGTYSNYAYDEDYYVRALEPDKYSEEGFAELLERNMWYDETSEDLGIYNFASTAADVYTGETVIWPDVYGYAPMTFETETTDDTLVLRTYTTCEVQDYPEDGYWMPAEYNYYEVELWAVSYEIKSITTHAAVYQKENTTPVVFLSECRYSGIEYGEKVEGTIDPVSLENIPEEFTTMSLPEIQSDLKDGELSKEDAVKVLDNIWAYAWNTKTSHAAGPAIAYDDDYNEYEVHMDSTMTAYKGNFIEQVDIITPVDETMEAYEVVTQKSARPEGVAEIRAVDGVVGEWDGYISMPGLDYNTKKQFSASPLIHDFMLGMAINEAVQYNLTSWSEADEWGTNGYEFNLFNASKDGNNISIEWEVFSYYGDPEWGSSLYINIEIVDNFVAKAVYGDAKEAPAVTYTMTQGEYDEFTGTVLEYDFSQSY